MCNAAPNAQPSKYIETYFKGFHFIAGNYPKQPKVAVKFIKIFTSIYTRKNINMI